MYLLDSRNSATSFPESEPSGTTDPTPCCSQRSWLDAATKCCSGWHLVPRRDRLCRQTCLRLRVRTLSSWSIEYKTGSFRRRVSCRAAAAALTGAATRRRWIQRSAIFQRSAAFQRGWRIPSRCGVRCGSRGICENGPSPTPWRCAGTMAHRCASRAAQPALTALARLCRLPPCTTRA